MGGTFKEATDEQANGAVRRVADPSLRVNVEKGWGRKASRADVHERERSALRTAKVLVRVKKNWRNQY